VVRGDPYDGASLLLSFAAVLGPHAQHGRI
jgi:hypothetical protein